MKLHSNTIPSHVVILGLGPSVSAWFEIARKLGGRHAFCDEVWAINALGGVVQHDILFHMDDVRIQEIRAQARPESNIAKMLEWLRVHPVPVITSRLHSNYPALVEFPLEAVINHLVFDYFNSTAAYALAYAIHIGVKKVTVFGCDYTYPNSHDAEKGRACLEFWLGQAAARGVQICLPKTTSLMDAISGRQDRLYGYDTRTVKFSTRKDGSISVEFTEVATLPTADEIERRYDHSIHPNSLVSEATQ